MPPIATMTTGPTARSATTPTAVSMPAGIIGCTTSGPTPQPRWIASTASVTSAAVLRSSCTPLFSVR